MARPSRQRDPRRDPLAQTQTQPPTMLVEAVHVELFYDYSRLSDDQRSLAERAARTIKPRLRRAAEDIFVIGAALNEVRATLDHGQFGEWLAAVFGLSQRMAQHFMNVAARLQDKSEKFSLLPPSSLYLLAAPSTPEAAIRAVEERLDAGDRPQLARVERIVELSKLAQRAPAAPPAAAPVPSSEAGRLTREVQAAMALVLEEALTQALAQLDSIPGDKRPGALWGELFHNSDYSRVRNEVAALLRQVREKRAGGE